MRSIRWYSGHLTVCVFGGLARGRSRKNAFFYIKYSFKVKSPSFILFTSKPNSMSQSRLKRCQHILQGDRKRKPSPTIAVNLQPSPLSPFMLPLPYSIVAREGVRQSRIKQGKEKNPTTMRSSRTAMGKAPKTVTLVFFF